MDSLLQCKKCGNTLSSSDKFCGACGSPADVPPPPRKEPRAATATSTVRCQLCGTDNPVDAAACESCGNVLASASSHSSTPDQQKKPQTTSAPLNFFQSWKLTAALAVILIGVVIFFSTSQKEKDNHVHSPEMMSQNASAMIKEIESLQTVVDNNPQDTQAMLRLANLLHDVRAFPRAIDMYDRYLKLNPSNPDARVDLGIMYFQMAMLDSTKFDEYISIAKTEMEKAISYAPKHQLAYFNLGIVTLQGGDMQGSHEWFAKCIAIDSTTESARRAQQLMQQHSFTKP